MGAMKLGSPPDVIPPLPPRPGSAQLGLDPDTRAMVLAAGAAYTSRAGIHALLPPQFKLPDVSISGARAQQLNSSHAAGFSVVRAAAGRPASGPLNVKDADVLYNAVRAIIAPPNGHVLGLVYLVGVCGGLAAEVAGAYTRRPLMQRLGKTAYDSAALAGGFARHGPPPPELLLGAAGALSDILGVASPESAAKVDDRIDLLSPFFASKDSVDAAVQLAAAQLDADPDWEPPIG
jgi:hypothetical protein